MRSKEQLEEDIQYWETLVKRLKATNQSYINQESILNKLKWELAEHKPKKPWWRRLL